MTTRRILHHVLVAPVLLLLGLHRVRLVAFITGSRLLALIPGRLGVTWRMSWYEHTLAGCGDNLYVDWMGAFRTAKAKVGANVFVGPFCWLGWVEVGDDVMLGGHITVLSGAHHHNFDRFDVAMARQGGELSLVKIGDDVWVGNGAIIMADVAPGTVIGAGAVVTKTFDPHCVLAGVPARVIRKRGDGTV